MGQQQLFLMILVTVIVGLATIVAINTFEESHIEANKTAVRQDIMIIINDAQKYYFTPTSMGGGGQSFSEITPKQIVTIDPHNSNGDYSISGDKDQLSVTGQGSYEEVDISANAKFVNNKLSVEWHINE